MSVARYLKRMDDSIEDKMRVINAIPKDAEYVLDVGCAAGHVTAHMANLRPQTYFHGIDVELPFVGMANAERDTLKTNNVGFSHNWLSDLHEYRTRYDAITFMSVMHEIYSYGKGVTSVVKALCDAYELLNPDGVIIIRDMLRPEMGLGDPDTRMRLYDKLNSQPEIAGLMQQYDSVWDIHRGMPALNDFLLHYLYADNWANEIRENYMFWSAQDYIGIGRVVLQMEPVLLDCYLLEYVENRWRKELWLNQMEISDLYSTGVVVLRK